MKIYTKVYVGGRVWPTKKAHANDKSLYKFSLAHREIGLIYYLYSGRNPDSARNGRDLVAPAKVSTLSAFK